MEETIEKSIEELKAEADTLGIVYNKNIGPDKLAAKIEEHYSASETSGAAIIAAANSKSTKVVEEPRRTIRQMANNARDKASVTSIVTITDNDQRENNLTTIVSVTCANQYFDLGTKRIPLNVPVELEQGFIDVLNEIKIPMHVRDQRTGQSKTVLRNRYSVAFETMEK